MTQPFTLREWWRRMRWHWARLWMDVDDAIAWQSDPPEDFQ